MQSQNCRANEQSHFIETRKKEKKTRLKFLKEITLSSDVISREESKSFHPSNYENVDYRSKG